MLIPDGASPSSDVVRADWNPDTGLFEFRDIIAMNADTGEDRPRPVAVSAAPDGNAYVVFQRSGTIQRIVDPESPTPTVDLVATTSDGRGASAVAATYGPGGPLSPPRIVVAETTGLREVVGTATDPAAPRTTVDSGFDLPGAQLVSALTYEIVDAAAGTGDLYAGTADSLPAAEGDANADRVFRWQRGGLPTQVADGLSTVGGFGPRHGAACSCSTTRRSSRRASRSAPAACSPSAPRGPASPAARRARRTTRRPPSPSPVRARASARSTAAARRRARRRSPRPSWPRAGTRSPSVPRACRCLEIRRFEVDTTAPIAAPEVVSPAAGTFTSPRPYFEFDPAAGDDEGTYECKITPVTEPAAEGEFAPCEEGRPQAGLAAGEHTIVIRARDAAGNPEAFDDASPVSTAVTFTVGTPAPGADVPAAPNGPLTAPDSVVRLADGLHISTGALQAPDGSIWVADHNAGLCRVSKPTFDGAGHIEHPQIPGEGGPNTSWAACCPRRVKAPTRPASRSSWTRRPATRGAVTRSRSCRTAPGRRASSGAPSGTRARSASIRSTRSRAR